VPCWVVECERSSYWAGHENGLWRNGPAISLDGVRICLASSQVPGLVHSTKELATRYARVDTCSSQRWIGRWPCAPGGTRGKSGWRG
jgi:hypothetical protein